MRPVYARRVLSPMRRRALRLAAWLSVVAGAYGIVASHHFWDFLPAASAARSAPLISLAVITDRPEPRTKTHCQDRAGSERTACAVVLIVIVVAEV